MTVILKCKNYFKVRRNKTPADKEIFQKVRIIEKKSKLPTHKECWECEIVDFIMSIRRFTNLISTLSCTIFHW